MGSSCRSDKKQILLKNGILIGKKTNQTTPSQSWKQLSGEELDPKFSMNYNNSSVSARKIGANLWEIQPPQFNFIKNHSDHVGDGDGVIQHRRRSQRRYEKDDQSKHQPYDNHPHSVSISFFLKFHFFFFFFTLCNYSSLSIYLLE